MNVNISSKNISLLDQRITALQNENNLLKEQLALLQEQFDWLRKQVFGRKTKQTTAIMDGGIQLSLFPKRRSLFLNISARQSVHMMNG